MGYGRWEETTGLHNQTPLTLIGCLGSSPYPRVGKPANFKTTTNVHRLSPPPDPAERWIRDRVATVHSAVSNQRGARPAASLRIEAIYMQVMLTIRLLGLPCRRLGSLLTTWLGLRLGSPSLFASSLADQHSMIPQLGRRTSATPPPIRARDDLSLAAQYVDASHRIGALAKPAEKHWRTRSPYGQTYSWHLLKEARLRVSPT